MSYHHPHPPDGSHGHAGAVHRGSHVVDPHAHGGRARPTHPIDMHQPDNLYMHSGYHHGGQQGSYDQNGHLQHHAPGSGHGGHSSQDMAAMQYVQHQHALQQQLHYQQQMQQQQMYAQMVAAQQHEQQLALYAHLAGGGGTLQPHPPAGAQPPTYATQRGHPNMHALQNIAEQSSPASSEGTAAAEERERRSAGPHPHLHAAGGVISAAAADGAENKAEEGSEDESDTSSQAAEKAEAEEEKQRLEMKAIRIAEENKQWIDYDTQRTPVRVIVGSEVKSGELTIRTNPLKGFASIQLEGEEDVLASFILGTKEFNVTVAEEKLALHVSEAGAVDARHTGPTAVLLVAADYQEAKALASALCVGVFGNQPIIRGAKEREAKEKAEKKKAAEEKLRAKGFMKAKVMYDHQGRPYVPKPVGQKGRTAKDSRYDGNGRFKYKGGGGDSDSVGGGSMSSASHFSHAASQRGERKNAARPPGDHNSRPVRSSPRPGSIVSRISTVGDGGDADADSRYLLSDDDTYEPPSFKGIKGPRSLYGDEDEDRYDPPKSHGGSKGGGPQHSKEGDADDDISEVSDDATYASRASKAPRKKKSLSVEQRREQLAKFREKDEAIMKAKAAEFKKKREDDAKKKEKEEYEKDLYKLNRDMIVMRARARHTNNKQQVHEKLHAKKMVEDGDAKSETPSTSTGPSQAKSSKSKATHSVVSSALSVISTISAKPTDVSDFNYNSHFNSLIPGNSPETQKRLDARRQVRAVRKQEAEFVKRIEKIRTANENKVLKAEQGREYEMLKLLDKEAKMDEIIQREEAQFHYATKLQENRHAAKLAEVSKKQKQHELNRQMSSMMHPGAGNRMHRDGSTFSHLGVGMKSQASGISIGMQHYMHGMHQPHHHKFNANAMENLYQGHGSRKYNKGGADADAGSPDQDTLVVGGALDDSVFEGGAEVVQSTVGSPVHPVKKPGHRFHAKFKTYLKQLHLDQGGTNETFAKLHPRGIAKPHTMKLNKKTGAKVSDVQMGYFTFAATMLCSFVRKTQAMRHVQSLRREINAATIQYWFKSILARRKLLWLDSQTQLLAAMELRRHQSSMFIGYCVFRMILRLRRRKKARRAAEVQEQVRLANMQRKEEGHRSGGGSRGSTGRNSPTPSLGDDDATLHSAHSAGSAGSAGKAEKKEEEKERAKMGKEDAKAHEIATAAKKEAKAKAKAVAKEKKKGGGCCIM